MWKWIPKPEKKATIKKVDVLKTEDVTGEEVGKEDAVPSGDILPVKLTSLHIRTSVNYSCGVQAILLTTQDNRASFETSMGELYVDTGTYF